MFASLGMKLAQNGSSKEWAVKVSFVQSLTWNREWVVQTTEIFSPLKTKNSAQLRTQIMIDLDTFTVYIWYRFRGYSLVYIKKNKRSFELVPKAECTCPSFLMKHLNDGTLLLSQIIGTAYGSIYDMECCYMISGKERNASTLIWSCHVKELSALANSIHWDK